MLQHILKKSIPLVILIWSNSCENVPIDNPIPFVNFEPIRINLLLPEYIDLTIDKQSIFINNGGVRGIILYRKNAENYIAFERNCSYQSNSACSTVDLHPTNLYMVDNCCDSRFSFDGGIPIGGVARFPLRIYKTELSNNLLVISDEIVNGI